MGQARIESSRSRGIPLTAAASAFLVTPVPFSREVLDRPTSHPKSLCRERPDFDTPAEVEPHQWRLAEQYGLHITVGDLGTVSEA